MTVIGHHLRSLALCANPNGNDVVAPRAIPQADDERLCEPVIGRLRAVNF